MKTISRVIAVVCDRCGYVEAPAFEGVTYRHCKAEMRPIGRTEYHNRTFCDAYGKYMVKQEDGSTKIVPAYEMPGSVFDPKRGEGRG